MTAPETTLSESVGKHPAPFTDSIIDALRRLFVEYGFEVERVDVECPGWRFGRNGQARADTEAILFGVRRLR